MLLVLLELVLNHTNVGVFAHDVTVGASTVHDVSCVAPLYTSANVHVLFAVELNVDPFPFHFAVNVTAAFFVCAYHVHHHAIFIECVAFDHTDDVWLVELVLYHITVCVIELEIVGVVTLHVVAPSYQVQVLVLSDVHPSKLLLFGLYVAVVDFFV